jgi:hypothetical protein
MNTTTATAPATNHIKRHESCIETRCGCCQTWNVKLGFPCMCKGETKVERLDRIMARAR